MTIAKHTDGSTLDEGTALGSPIVLNYLEMHSDDPAWSGNMTERLTALESGVLTSKQRTLIFAAVLFIIGQDDAARDYARKARNAGASTGDLKFMIRILEHYQGLRLMQDAQRIVTFWCEGHFPRIKETGNKSTAGMLDEIEQSRGYIANGFRVYSADGNWLRLYIDRAEANKKYSHTLTPAEVQLLSFVITMRNHMYSANFNDGCILVHEKLARKGGMGSEHILEALQIIEVCDSLATGSRASRLLA